MSKEEVKTTFEVWLTVKELAPRLKSSTSGIYSLVSRNSGIPYVRLSPKKIIFNWRSVSNWLHEKETERRKNQFEE